MAELGAFNPTGIDQLSEPSRRFYESSRMKMLASLVYAALGLTFLGLTANFGGRASALRVMRAGNAVDIGHRISDDAIYTVQVNGLGFATFCHFIGFTLCTSAAFLISPYCHGSAKEIQLLYKPKEHEHGESAAGNTLDEHS